jgi:hypothetical protein
VLLGAVPLLVACVTPWPGSFFLQGVLVWISFGVLAGAGLALVESLASGWRDDGRREVCVLLLGLVIGMTAVCGPIFEVEYVRALIQLRSFPRALAMVEARLRYGACKTALGVGVEDGVSLALAIATPLAGGAAIRVSRSRLGLGLAVVALSATTLLLVIPLDEHLLVIPLDERRAHGVLAWILLPTSFATVKLVVALERGRFRPEKANEAVHVNEAVRFRREKANDRGARRAVARSRPTP